MRSYRPLRALFGGLVVALSGCAAFEPASPGREQKPLPDLPPLDWPERYLAPLTEIAREPLTAEDILDLAGAGLAEHVVVGKTPDAAPEGWDRLYRGIYGEGTIGEDVTVSASSEGEGHDAGRLRFSFVTNWHRPTRLEAKRKEARRKRALWFFFDIMSFELHEPGPSPLGLVVALSSWGGQRREEAIRDKLIARRWAVLTCSPPAKSREPFEVEIRNAADIGRVAREVARELDQRIADAAYGVEGALAFLEERRPQLMQKPLFIIGYSAGAAVAPAVAARLEDRVRGLVLVGAGSNLLVAAFEGEFGGQPLRVRSADDADVVEELGERYLAASRLDPWHVAPHCARIPVLMLHARSDRIVPAAGGEALWERLARPDIYRLPFGHTWLFWRLPSFRSEIADWLERHAEHVRRGSGAVRGR